MNVNDWLKKNNEECNNTEMRRGSRNGWSNLAVNDKITRDNDWADTLEATQDETLETPGTVWIMELEGIGEEIIAARNRVEAWYDELAPIDFNVN